MELDTLKYTFLVLAITISSYELMKMPIYISTSLYARHEHDEKDFLAATNITLMSLNHF